MTIDKAEQAFRAQMRALAHKGGAVTKRRHGNDPTYYRDIGRLGGVSSGIARRAKIAGEPESERPGEAPIVEKPPSITEAAQTFARSDKTLADILAELDGDDQPGQPTTNRWRSATEANAARTNARIPREATEDDPPWDPWR